MNKIILIFALLALPMMAVATSFDCNKASTKVEKMICSSKELSKRDDDLEIAYKNLINRITDETSRKYLISEQRDWINNIRNGCQDEECLSESYNLRTLYFRGVNGGLEDINSPDRFKLITAPKEIESIKSDFQNDLTKSGINIHLESCPIVLSAPFHRARVNGVICKYEASSKHSALMMCNESMVGHFVMQLYSFGIDSGAVKEFAKTNCFKGG